VEGDSDSHLPVLIMVLYVLNKKCNVEGRDNNINVSDSHNKKEGNIQEKIDYRIFTIAILYNTWSYTLHPYLNTQDMYSFPKSTITDPALISFLPSLSQSPTETTAKSPNVSSMRASSS
jgi:hypothetical protein